MPFEMVAKRYSFSSQCSLLISLKTSENQKLSDVLNIRKPKVSWCFQGNEKGTLGREGLKQIDTLKETKRRYARKSWIPYLTDTENMDSKDDEDAQFHDDDDDRN